MLDPHTQTYTALKWAVKRVCFGALKLLKYLLSYDISEQRERGIDALRDSLILVLSGGMGLNHFN
jgi:hypothetical protein